MRLLQRSAAPALGMLLALALLRETRGLDQVVSGDQLGPGFWPRLVLIGLAAACLVRLVSTLARPPAPAIAEGAGGGAVAVEAPAPISRPKLTAAIVVILLYALATPALGFPLTTAGFILAFMWLCGTRSTLAIAANALIGTVGLLYLFVKVVYLPLPKGDGPFETLTLALYRVLRIF